MLSSQTRPVIGVVPTTLSNIEIDLLVAWMEDETALQQELLVVLETQREALRVQDLPALEACLKGAAPLLSRLEEMTRRRLRVFTSVGKRLNMGADRIRLTQLEGMTLEEDRARFSVARANFVAVLESIRIVNRANSAVVRCGLDLHRAIVQTVFGGGVEPVTYTRNAKSSSLPSIKRVLSTEI
ncbi:MAG: hypothetical protein EXS14_10465 [Planctomycetes bacterium]|nr:hypothetical protein [Planctomycetota bacterium]